MRLILQIEIKYSKEKEFCVKIVQLFHRLFGAVWMDAICQNLNMSIGVGVIFNRQNAVKMSDVKRAYSFIFYRKFGDL